MPGEKHHNWNERIANSPAEDKLYDLAGYKGEMRVEMLQLYYEHNKNGFKDFVDNLSSNEKILDLGAGRGSALIRFLRDLGKAENVISLDLDERNLDYQKERDHAGNSLVQADATNLPFEDQSLDIISENVIRADNDINQANSVEIDAEIKRVLKPGGYYITSESGKVGFELVMETFGLKIYKYSPKESVG